MLPTFLAEADARGLAARVDLLAGSFRDVALPRDPFDLIVLANVLHLEPARAAQALVARFASALRPGGAVLIVDMLDGAPGRSRAHASYALHLALRIPGSFPHHEADMRRWLADAGLPTHERISFDDVGQDALGALLAMR